MSDTQAMCQNACKLGIVYKWEMCSRKKGRIENERKRKKERERKEKKKRGTGKGERKREKRKSVCSSLAHRRFDG